MVSRSPASVSCICAGAIEFVHGRSDPSAGCVSTNQARRFEWNSSRECNERWNSGSLQICAHTCSTANGSSSGHIPS